MHVEEEVKKMSAQNLGTVLKCVPTIFKLCY